MSDLFAREMNDFIADHLVPICDGKFFALKEDPAKHSNIVILEPQHADNGDQNTTKYVFRLIPKLMNTIEEIY